MIFQETEILLNREYGGFKLPMLVVDWLKENKGWHIPEIYSGKEYPSKDEKDAPLLMVDAQWSRPLVGKHPAHEEEEVRINPDIIEAVKALKEKYKNELKDIGDKYSSEMSDEEHNMYSQLRDLSTIVVKKVQFSFEITSDDGIESVEIGGFNPYADWGEDDDDYDDDEDEEENDDN